MEPIGLRYRRKTSLLRLRLEIFLRSLRPSSYLHPPIDHFGGILNHPASGATDTHAACEVSFGSDLPYLREPTIGPPLLTS